MTTIGRAGLGSRRLGEVSGPHPIRTDDIGALNSVFSSAFTERYRKDGMVGVHVPNLSPAIWRFAIEDAGAGAMLWRGARDEIVAFNICHHSGIEGWMGPLAVTSALQNRGLGKTIVREGAAWLESVGAQVIGLETMPRTVDNIGFYSSLGFVPGHLTITLTVEGAYAEFRTPQLSRVEHSTRESLIEACAALTSELAPGYDFTREIELTQQLGLGDTIVLEEHGDLSGFAVCHTAALVEGRGRDELRVLKLVARTLDDVDRLVTQLADLARRTGTRRVAIRMQAAYGDLYTRLIDHGARVRWTDLRMALRGHGEHLPKHGVVLSNWEI